MPRLTSRTLLSLLACLALAPSAGAQAPQAPGKGLGFAVEPLGSTAGVLEFRASPGDRVRGALLLRNPGSDRVRVVLRAQDASTAATGGLQYDDPRPGGVGRWLRLGEKSVVLEPHASKRVAVSALIPAGARLGDHVAGIVSYDAADLARVRREHRQRGRVSLSFISRFAVAVRFRVPGPAGAALTPGPVEFLSTPAGAAIVIEIRNSGRLLIPSSRGRITVSRGGRRLLTQRIDLTTFVPGTKISYPLPWKGAPAHGTYHVKGFVNPAKGRGIVIDREVTFGSAEGRAFTARTGLEAQDEGVPWWMWALLSALATTSAALALVAHRRRGRVEIAAVSAPVPDSPVAPVAPPAADPPRLTAAPAPSAAAAAARPERNGHVDLNTASVEELTRLPGVGRGAARRIVGHREEYGDFESVQDLSQVEGFDAPRIARLSARATTSARDR